MIVIDEQINNTLNKIKYKLLKYPQYFSPEIQSFNATVDKTKEIEIETISDEFNEKRLKGENDDKISEIIRNDLIEEFIVFVKRENYPLKSIIKPSIFETNSFLMNRNSNLIQYAAFFGSVQIFKYLFLNEVEITPILWIYAVHSDNPEMIYLLEENTKNKEKLQYNEFFLEAIKCNNNDVANYIHDNYCCSKKSKPFIDLHDFDFNIDESISMYFKLIFILNENLLNYAAKKNYQEILKLLLDFKVNKIIEPKCFERCKKLTYISLPLSIKSIGSYAFSECSSLKEIIIPESLTSIGECSFNKCTSLVKILIPSSVKKIERSAFNECSSLAQITIPSSITSIEPRVFYKCISLEKVDIPSSVTLIDVYAFFECSSLKQISLPSSLTKIEYGTFAECSSLSNITIPSSVTSIKKYAFYKCFSLSQVSFDSQSLLTSIDEYAFCGCPLLNQISIPQSAFPVGDEVFSSNVIVTKL